MDYLPEKKAIFLQGEQTAVIDGQFADMLPDCEFFVLVVASSVASDGAKAMADRGATTQRYANSKLASQNCRT